MLKNLADIKDSEKLACMEAEYTAIRFAELVVKEFASYVDFGALFDIRKVIYWNRKKKYEHNNLEIKEYFRTSL